MIYTRLNGVLFLLLLFLRSFYLFACLLLYRFLFGQLLLLFLLSGGIFNIPLEVIGGAP